MTTEIAITFSEMEKLAVAIAKSQLFGMKTPEQALALMAIAQAEGSHPALAARDYDIIQGRPALKADAMLARFQKAGGKIEWHDYSDLKVSATLSHPVGGSVLVEWDMERARVAGLAKKDNWLKWPRNMLRCRVISEGVRTVFPGSTNSMYTPEEVADFEPSLSPASNTTSNKSAAILPSLVTGPKPLPIAPNVKVTDPAALKEFVIKYSNIYNIIDDRNTLNNIYSDVLSANPSAELLEEEVKKTFERYFPPK